MIHARILIDPEITAAELIMAWVNGNKNDVINALKTDHAGLTAMVIVTGLADKVLSRSDCNEITNRLIDARKLIVDNE